VPAPASAPAPAPASTPAPGPTVTGLAPDYPIRTERLLLRPWRSDEEATFFRLRGDPEVVRYLYQEPITRDEAGEVLAQRSSLHAITEPGQWLNLAVEVASTGFVAGDVGIAWTSDEHRTAEVGYTFLPDHQGHGYATEAAAAMVDLAFTGLAVHRVVGHLDGRNDASAAVLRRLGMRLEAHLVENEWVKGEWTDDKVYAVLDREWAARKGQPRS